jgi:hypothetical protein
MLRTMFTTNYLNHYRIIVAWEVGKYSLPPFSSKLKRPLVRELFG